MDEDHEAPAVSPPASDPAAAFEALRAEVAALGASLKSGGVEKSAPDYTLTHGEISATLAKLESHPALRMTPEAYNQQIRSAAEHTRQRDEQNLRQAVNEVERATKAVNRLLEQRKAQITERQRLAMVGGLGLVIGMVAWAVFSGPVARALPASWAVPEKMAAATLHLDRWQAGVRLLASVSPAGWAMIEENMRLEMGNREKLAGCRAAANKARGVVICTLKVAPRLE